MQCYRVWFDDGSAMLVYAKDPQEAMDSAYANRQDEESNTDYAECLSEEEVTGGR